MKSNAIIVFQKEFKIGTVKTRLAATLGLKAALDVYKELVFHTYDILQKVSDQCDVIVFLNEKLEERPPYLPDSFQLFTQHGNSLGERISHAFEKVFSLGYSSVAIIGTDCLELREEHLRQTFHELKVIDVCIGPAYDGGYYLIALNAYHPELFQDIPWSTDLVLMETMQILTKRQLSYTFLEVLNDIDTEIDWIKAKQKHAESSQ
jgi:uncharacterized protein